MAESETKQQLQPRRLTYLPPSQIQYMTSGRGKVAKEALSFVRNIPRSTGEDSANTAHHLQKMNPNSYLLQTCSCDRKTKNILCQACGHVFVGRMRMSCPLHPTTIHLMDIDCCPECRANHLKEFSDYSMKRE